MWRLSIAVLREEPAEYRTQLLLWMRELDREPAGRIYESSREGGLCSDFKEALRVRDAAAEGRRKQERERQVERQATKYKNIILEKRRREREELRQKKGERERQLKGIKETVVDSNELSFWDEGEATLTIAKTEEGYIFGGYSDVAWTGAAPIRHHFKHRELLSHPSGVECPSLLKNHEGVFQCSAGAAFQFALKSHAGVGMVKMPLAAPSGENAIYCDDDSGPDFGGGELRLGGGVAYAEEDYRDMGWARAWADPLGDKWHWTKQDSKNSEAKSRLAEARHGYGAQLPAMAHERVGDHVEHNATVQPGYHGVYQHPHGLPENFVVGAKTCTVTNVEIFRIVDLQDVDFDCKIMENYGDLTDEIGLPPNGGEEPQKREEPPSAGSPMEAAAFLALASRDHEIP
eukprot:SAG31_NODE_2771_length_5116_cov_3.598964_2_plen_403_part_00